MVSWFKTFKLLKINTHLFKWNLLRISKLFMDSIFTRKRVIACCFDILVRRLGLVWCFSKRVLAKTTYGGRGGILTLSL